MDQSGGSAEALASLVRCDILRHMDTEDSGHLFAVVPNLECMEDVRDPSVCISMKMKVKWWLYEGKNTRAAYLVIVGVKPSGSFENTSVRSSSVSGI